MTTVITKQNVFTPDLNSPICYIVTDIETDGPDAGKNSIRTFASVAVDQQGKIIGQFEGHLLPLDGAQEDPGTMDFFKTQPPEVWADVINDPKKPEEVMQKYVDWIRELPMQGVFVAHPLAFDGYWMDWYLRKFTGLRISCGFYGGERLFFNSGAIDLQSLLMGVLGIEYKDCRRNNYPKEWFGGYAHTHCALEDAMGYAHILSMVLEKMRKRN